MISSTISSPAMRGTIERLLGRGLTSADGLQADVLAEAEVKLGEPIPEPLRSLYAMAGKLRPFMSSFQRFAKPSEILRRADLLIFLEENQGVCDWGVNAAGAVWQCQNENDCYDCELTLERFLEIILYYQIAQGAEYAYSLALPFEQLDELLAPYGWSLVVDNNGLVIHARDSYLIWFLANKDALPADDLIFLSGMEKAPQSWHTRYALEIL